MKVLTILGTRPEIIRLSRVIPTLDELCEQVIVHTGQNFDPNLNDIFFSELGVRQPNHFLGAQGTFGEQVAIIFRKMEEIFAAEKPDRFLVLGDTNSSLAAFIAKRLAIPVYHMEAGNRCYDDRVPEEVNRRVIDHSSDILLPYTERSRANLLREGIPGERIHVTGNPIFEVIRYYEPLTGTSQILSSLGLEENRFFLVTLHRAENVDIEARLRSFTTAFEQLASAYGYPVIVSTHPRTRARLKSFGVNASESGGVRYVEPFGFFDFLTLQKSAYCVLSDSGTVQEECAIFQRPVVTLRDSTERPETIECGTNILSGADPELILQSVKVVTSRTVHAKAPPEYLVDHVSHTVAQIVLGYLWKH